MSLVNLDEEKTNIYAGNRIDYNDSISIEKAQNEIETN